ncbi:hypothetical protein, partial [Clostridium sp. chh4-2]|uniref:hypothetical protein n=1 Tax=Clostridium sp. chh4-2 TaxID=2067550 RepID=UPI001A9A50F1
GRLETDSEFSFYLSLSVLACLRITKGVPYDPNCPFFILPHPGSRKDRLSLPRISIPGWFSLAWLKTILVRRYLCRITFTWIMKGFSEMPSGFTLNVKAFHKKTSPFTLNHEGISEKDFTVDVKTYSLLHQIFFILS